MNKFSTKNHLLLVIIFGLSAFSFTVINLFIDGKKQVLVENKNVRSINSKSTLSFQEPKDEIIKINKKQVIIAKQANVALKITKSEIIAQKVEGNGKMPLQDRMDLAWKHDRERSKDLITGDVPTERLLLAFAEAKKRIAEKGLNRSPIPNTEWIERGPSTVGGRTRALMFDPNDGTNKKVWAGSVGGGIWYNNDITSSSVTWTRINDFLASIAITSLAYDPTNTNTFYMGTGEGFNNLDAIRGVGVFKSTDAGATWAHLATTSGFYYVNDVVVTPAGTVIVATTAGIYRSTNGGTSWTTSISGNSNDLEVASNGTIYAGQNPSKVKKSTDDGLTFTDITPDLSGVRVELTVAPSDPNIVYAVAGDGQYVEWFKKTINGGTTWTNVTMPVLGCSQTPGATDFTNNQSWYNMILNVSPTNANIVLAGGLNFYRSLDGGSTWAGISEGCSGGGSIHTDHHAVVFRPGSPNEAVFGGDGGIYYSTNAGNSAANPTYSNRNNNYNVTQYYACAMKNDVAGGDFYLAGAQDNGTQELNAAGVGSGVSVSGGDGTYCFIDQDNPNIQIVSSQNNYWTLLSRPGVTGGQIMNTNDGSFVSMGEYNSVDNILYVNKNDSIVYRISGIGGTRTIDNVNVTPIGTMTALKSSPHNTNVLFIGAGGRVYKVSNVNTTLNPTVTKVGTSSFGSISSIDVGADDNQLLITISNYGSTSVYETKDGSTWMSKEGDLPDMPVRWGLYNPENRNQVLLATEVGVWSTDNLSVTLPEWDPTNTGLCNTRCDMLKYRTIDKEVAVATHGRGLFTTNVFSTPIAAFSSNQRMGYPGLNVQFSDGSVAANNSWSWNFGDGGTSTLQNPTHIYTTPGTYTVSLAINNGAMSETKTSYIKILPNISAASYLTVDGGDFESNAGHFMTEDVSGTKFEKGNSSITGKDGTASGTNAWVLGLTDALYLNSTEARLYSPNFTLSQTGSGSYLLEFKTKFKFENSYDGFIVEYSTDKGITWSKLGNSVVAGWYNAGALNGGSFSSGSPIFSGTSSGFETKLINITSLTGQNVAFRFVCKTSTTVAEVGMAIDDFRIHYVTPDFTADKTTICLNESIVVSDNTIGSVSSYSWDFGVGASPATANTQGPHTVTYSSNGTKSITLTLNNGTVSKLRSSYITVNNPPTNKTVTAIPTEICVGETASIIINGSLATTSYQLRNDANNANVGTAQNGNGSNLTFDLGAIGTTTTYNVLATLTGCTTLMTLKPTVTVKPMPLERDLSATQTNFCGSSSGSADVIVVASEIGTTYQLREDISGTLIGSAANGTGSDLNLSTGTVGSTTTYNVLATRSGCIKQMAEKITVSVGDLPFDRTVYENESSFCEGLGTYILVVSSQTGVTYQLRNEADDSPIGSPVAGTGGDIQLPTGAVITNTTYNILADRNGCKLEMSSKPAVSIIVGPLNKTIAAATSNFCGQTSASTNIVLTASQSGVTYQLYNAATNATVGTFFNGNGTNRNFATGTLTSTTTFYMKGTNSSGCYKVMSDQPTVTIGAYAADKVVNASPLEICVGSSASIIVENAESGVTYKLRKDADNSIVATMTTSADNPANVSASTGTLSNTTVYNIFTDKASCTSSLLTKPTVTIIPTPEERTAALDKTSICGIGSAIVTITNAQSGVNYLLKDASSALIGSALGNDNNITIPTGDVSSSTTYSVTADRKGCTKAMLSTLNLEVKALPIDKDVAISPSEFCSEGSPVITVLLAESGVTYQLRKDAGNILIGNTGTGSGVDLQLPAESVTATTAYNVLADKNGCSLQLLDKPSVTINEVPLNKVLSVSAFKVCSGNSVIILVEGSELLVEYILRDSATHVGIDTVIGTGEQVSLNTPTLTQRKAFEVAAHRNACSSTMDTKPSINVTLPITNVNASAMLSSICGPGSTDIVISNSESSVSYQLRNNVGNISIGLPVAGNGANILLPTNELTATTTFNVMTTKDDCSLQLTSKPVVEIKSIPEVSITKEASILKATVGADTYQWYLNEELISGAIESEFTPIENGFYTVIVTLNGCETTSEPFEFEKEIPDGLSKVNGSKLSLSIFPNPVKDIVTLRHSSSWRGNMQLRVYNSLGALVMNEALPDKTSEKVNYKVDFGGLAEGVYYVEVVHTKGVVTAKVTKLSK